MDESRKLNPASASRPKPSEVIVNKRKSSWPFTFLVTVLVPVVAATVLYQLDSFDPAPLPSEELTRHVIAVPTRNDHMLRVSEFVGVGNLIGPEDLAYDTKSGVIYTGCADGWINRVTVNHSVSDSIVEKWINTGGRPLGIALGHNNELIVADPEKGLLNVTADGVVELLTDEADGQKFKTTDAVDVAHNGMIYFTDASYKYGLSKATWDILEGKPHGRLMSYDPATKATKEKVKKISHTRQAKGRVEKFIDNLPGMPDNIRYDGEGQYWIALAKGYTLQWDLAYRYPFIRKVLIIMKKYIGQLYLDKNAGVLAVDLAGEPLAHYYDPGLALVSTGIKIGNHLYCGSVSYPYIIRLNLKQYPVRANT